MNLCYIIFFSSLPVESDVSFPTPDNIKTEVDETRSEESAMTSQCTGPPQRETKRKYIKKSYYWNSKKGQKLQMGSMKMLLENSDCCFDQSAGTVETLDNSLLDIVEEECADVNKDLAVLTMTKNPSNVSEEMTSMREGSCVPNRKSLANSIRKKRKSKKNLDVNSKSLVKDFTERSSDNKITCNIKPKVNDAARRHGRPKVKGVSLCNTCSYSCTSSVTCTSSPMCTRQLRSSYMTMTESECELDSSIEDNKRTSLQVIPTSRPIQNIRYKTEINEKEKHFQEQVALITKERIEAQATGIKSKTIDRGGLGNLSSRINKHIIKMMKVDMKRRRKQKHRRSCKRKITSISATSVRDG